MCTVTGLLRGVKALRRVAEPQGNAHSPVTKRLLHLAVDGLVVLVLQMLQRVACRTGAQHARAHQHARVQGRLRLAGKVVRQRICGDIVFHFTADGLQVGGDLRPPAAAEGRGGQAAVAVYNGGQPLPQLQLAEARPKGRQICMAVDVDEPRRHQLAGGADHTPRVGVGQVAHLRDFSVFHRHVGGIGGAAGAVYHGAAPNQQV